MFDIGWSELLVIGAVALIAIGPKELPGVLRAVGQWMTKIRRMASEFQGQFQEAMREAEMAEIKKQVEEATSTANSITNFDPMASVRAEVDKMQDDLNRAIDQKVAETPPAETALATNDPGAVAAAAEAPPSAPATVPAPEPAPAPSSMLAPELATPGEPAATPKVAGGERP